MTNNFNTRFLYFFHNILIWVMLVLLLIAISICIYHNRKGGKCNKNNERNAYLLV